jgi:hypothetical protein
MATSLGSSSVTIVPDFDEAELKAKLDEISRNKPEIIAKILADSTKGDKTLAEFRAGADKTIKGLPTGDIKLTDSAALRKLVDLRASVDETIKSIPSIEPTLDDTKALAKAAALRVKLDVELKKAGVVDIDVRTDRALAQIAKFDVEAKALEDIGGNGGGGSGGGFLSFLSEGGGEGSSFLDGIVENLKLIGALAPVIVPALGAIVTEADGLLSGFTAAGLGAGSFALLAVPAIESVFSALGDTKKQLAALPAGTAQVVDGVKDLEGAWKKASAAFAPQVFDLLNKSIGILAGLLPDVLPFAQQFATSMAPILDELGTFTVSAGFKGFLKDMQGLEGPALESISTGLAHIGGNVGKLLTVMSQKDVIDALNLAFSILDGTVIALTGGVKLSMEAWDNAKQHFLDVVKGFETGWDGLITGEDDFDSATADVTKHISEAWNTTWANVTGWSKDGADAVTRYFDDMRKNVAGDVGDISSNVIGAFNDVYENTDRIWSSVSNSTSRTLGDIKSAFSAAVSGISGIWTGLEKDVETPVNFVLGIVSKVDSLLDAIPGVDLPKNLHLAGGGVVPGGVHGIDSVHTLLAPGELVIPSSHAAQFGDAARRAGIPMAAGGTVPTPVSGRGGALGAVNPTGGDVNPLTAIASGLAELGDLLAKGASAAVSGLLGSLVGDIPGSGVAKTLAQGMAKEAVSGITSAISGAAATGGGPAFGGASGSSVANATEAMKYLATNLFSGNLKAAAGAVASIFGESNWNPESVGTGGFGLIGWTGNTLGLPGGYKGPTGNASKDFDTQLAGIIGFVKASGDMGVIAEMIQGANGGMSIAELAQLWGRGVERYGINDVHAYGVDAATSILNGLGKTATTQNGGASNGYSYARGGRIKPYSAGGMITEPIAGIGLNSGSPYSFGENGVPEQIIPGGASSVGPQQQPMTQTQGMNMLNLMQAQNRLLQQVATASSKSTGGIQRGANRGAHQTGG